MNRLTRFWLPLAGAVLVLALLACCWLLKPARVCIAFNEQPEFHLGHITGPTTVGQTSLCPKDNLAQIEVRFATFGGWSASRLCFGLFDIPSLDLGPLSAAVPGDGAPVFLRPGQPVSQAIQPARDDLTGFRIMVVQPKQAATGQLRLSLARPGRPDEPIRQVVRDLKGLPDHDWALFEFPPLERSGGERLLLRLDLEESGPDAEVGLRSFGKGESAGFSIGGQEQAGALILREAYPPALSAGQPLVEKRLNSLWVTDNAFHAIAFAPQPNSAGQGYYFQLSAPQAGINNALTLWANKNRPDGGSLVMDDVPLKGSLVFRAYSAVPRAEAAAKLKAGVGQGRSLLFGSWRLVMLAALAQVLIGLAIVWGLVMARRTGNDKE